MAAPAGTLTYYTYVTLNAPGNSNGDATTLAAAFNGVTFPAISGTAATASAATAAVTISWPEAGIKVSRELVRDFVAQQCASLKASLNAPVTNIQTFTEITLS
jgi:hypothetical protein